LGKNLRTFSLHFYFHLIFDLLLASLYLRPL
jgi:hypothetical protein